MSPQTCTLTCINKVVAVYGHFVMFVTRAASAGQGSKSPSCVYHTVCWIISQKASLPPTTFLSLIEKKNKSKSTLPVYTLNIYFFPLSLCPFGSFPFCLVNFLMYKSNAFDRTFFSHLKKNNNNNSALYRSPFFGYCTPAVWQCVVYHARERERQTEKKRGGCLPGDAGNKMRHGGQAEGCMESGSVTCPRFSSR